MILTINKDVNTTYEAYEALLEWIASLDNT